MSQTTAPAKIAPDGSPVAVYLALPPHDALDLVADQVPYGGSVLDLGCGVGRLANPLAGRGFAVTGVDEHAPMLAHLDPSVTAVHGDIATLDLRRTFDIVVLASHLVNHDRHGTAFLDHLDGVMDGVHVHHEVHDRDAATFTASAHYTVEATTWTQRYRAVLLDDDAFDRALANAGLRRAAWLDHDDRWALARPVT
jgi:SAM-dependent methyltransferase